MAIGYGAGGGEDCVCVRVLVLTRGRHLYVWLGWARLDDDACEPPPRAQRVWPEASDGRVRVYIFSM